MSKYDYQWYKIFSQNIWKNNLIMNTILEVNFNLDIIFIQELSWSTICSIPSSGNCKGKSSVGVVNYSKWLMFTRTSETENDFPRVIIYVNIRLAFFCFSLCNNIINHRDILLVFFQQQWCFLAYKCLLRLFPYGFKVSQGY